MYILFFLMWVVFNGKLTLEIAVFGLVIAAAMYAFICKFMDYSVAKDIVVFKKSILILKYIAVLIKEIIKANMATFRLITSSKHIAQPVLVRFSSGLKTRTARVLLANSITLTPGTITVSLEEDEYVVHCLDKSMAEGMDSSVFVKLLMKMEQTGSERTGKEGVES